MDTFNRIANRLAALNFFQVWFETEHDGKRLNLRNNESIITPENWERLSGEFFTQRMGRYSEHFTIEDKIKLEFAAIESLVPNTIDQRVVKERYKEYLERRLERPEVLHVETKTDKLKAELGKYGFYELPTVKPLKEQSKQSLVELISSNGLPYSIAMLDYLGFLIHLERCHFKTKKNRSKTVSEWLDSDKDGRAVRGNMDTLTKIPTDKNQRYTAYLHKERVKKDYEELR